MKIMTRLGALLLAAAMILPLAGCGGGEEVSATVDKENVYRWEVDVLYYRNKAALESINGIEDLDAPEHYMDKRQALTNFLEQCIEDKVLYLLALDEGIQLTSEEEAEIEARCAKEREDSIQRILETQLDGDPAKKGEAEKLYDERLSGYNLTSERVVRSEKQYAVVQRYITKKMGDVSVDEEALRANYEQELTDQKERYREDPAAFAEDIKQTTFGMVYVPYLAKRVRYMRMPFPEDINQSIIDKEQELSEANRMMNEAIGQQSGDFDVYFDKISTLQQELKELYEDGLKRGEQGAKDLAATITEENFVDVMKQSNSDPAMDGEEAQTYGVIVYREADLYPEAFIEAAMQLTETGQVSPMFNTDNGYYIAQLIETYNRGEIPFEDVKENLVLVSRQQSEFQFRNQYAQQEMYRFAIKRNLEKLR